MTREEFSAWLMLLGFEHSVWLETYDVYAHHLGTNRSIMVRLHKTQDQVVVLNNHAAPHLKGSAALGSRGH